VMWIHVLDKPYGTSLPNHVTISSRGILVREGVFAPG
jgi:hypothetical protein